MLVPKLHIPKKSVAMFGTQSTGTIYYRLVKVGQELRRRGWEFYTPEFKIQDSMQFNWSQELSDMNVSYRMEQMMRHSYLTVFQYVGSRVAAAWIQAMKDTTLIPTFVDIDDDIFHIDPWNPGVVSVNLGEHYQVAAKEQMDVADGVLVSTEACGDAMREQTTNPNIYVVPNGLDPDWKQHKNVPTFVSSKGKRIRVGWQGAQAHEENLRLAKEPIHAILAQYPHVEFYFFGPKLPTWITKSDHPRILHEEQFVTVDQYPAKLASLGFDMAIAPLQDTLFNRAKSNLRWMEYSALKIPAVVSRVRAYECVRHDVDGLVVQDEEEWVTALSALIQSATKRKAIGEQTYERVWKDFHIGKAADVYEMLHKKYLPHNRKLNELTRQRFREARKNAVK